MILIYIKSLLLYNSCSFLSNHEEKQIVKFNIIKN